MMTIRAQRGSVLVSALAAVCVAGCVKQNSVESKAPSAAPSAETSALPDLELIPLAEGVWIHRSYADIQPWGRVSANGLLVIGPKAALLIDTPWNDAQMSELYAEVKRRFDVPITEVIVTHAHDDNLGGLAEAHRLGAHSIAEEKTLEIARDGGKPVPEKGFSSSRTLQSAAGVTAELFFPGPGHARDNIAVYLPDTKILFGGCLIKSADAQNLGNTADGDVSSWSASVDALEARFPEAEIVVPGHGDAGDRALLAHTRYLVSTHRP